VLRASVITTYTSRIARQHDTFTQSLLSTPCRPLYISGGQQAAYWASQHWVSHQTCRIYQVRQGMPTSCAPCSHLPGTRFMPACLPRKHICALSPTRCRSIIASHNDKVRAGHCHTILWSPCVGTKSIWQAQGQCLLLSFATRDIGSLAKSK
jgi:hypothetical protein